MGNVLRKTTVRGLAQYRKMVRLAHHDTLTSLPNRRWFDRHALRLLKLARARGKQPALLYIDLDLFKPINDTYGHHFGDLLLCGLTDRLREAAGKDGMVVRIGGDEFAMLMLDGRSEEEIAARSEELVAMFRQPVWLNGLPFRTTCSVGIASFPKHGEDIARLTEAADTALYIAKKRRDCVVAYHPGMEREAMHRLEAIANLRTGFENDRFELMYQPIFDLRTGAMSGVEALVRLRHSTRGLLMPEEFMMAAEGSGMMAPLGEWVVREACRQIKAWKGDGLQPPTVSVNVSHHYFGSGNFAKSVADALREADVPGASLELEITEACLSNDSFMKHQLDELRGLGLGLCIDSFGVGNSSLGVLGGLGADRLKIGQGFVAEMLDKERTTPDLSRAIIGLAHHLDMKVTAVGVEDISQERLLRDWGCDAVQGYLYARPLSADRMRTWLRQLLVYS